MISIENLVKQLPFSLHLETVDFSSETDDQIQKLAVQIKKSPQLKFIYYSGKKLSTFNFIKAMPIFQAIRENHNIQFIALDKCFLEELDQHQSNQLLACVKISGIKHLIIERDAEISKDCPVIKFIQMIPQTQIETLEWASCNLCFHDKDFYCTLLETLSSGNLTSLYLAAHTIGGSIENDASCIKPLLILFSHNLKEVRLDSNSLGCETSCADWDQIFKVINQRGSLKSLSLWDCDLELLEDPENQNFIELLVSFLQKTKLEKINLGRNRFSKEAATKLFKAAMQNKNLKLEFVDSGLTEKEIEELKRCHQNEEKAKMDIPSVAAAGSLVKPVLSAFSASTTTTTETAKPDPKLQDKKHIPPTTK